MNPQEGGEPARRERPSGVIRYALYVIRAKRLEEARGSIEHRAWSQGGKKQGAGRSWQNMEHGGQEIEGTQLRPNG